MDLRVLLSLSRTSLLLVVILCFCFILLPPAIAALAAIVFLVIAPLIAFVPGLVRAHKFGFGRESIVENLVCDLYADDVPPAPRAEVRTFDFAPEWSKPLVDSSSGKRELPLRHSLPDLRSDILDVVVGWMKGKCREQIGVSQNELLF